MYSIYKIKMGKHTAINVKKNNLELLFQEGIGLHQKGELAKAKTIYEQVLLRQPYNFDAVHLLGVIELQGKNYLNAIELIERAIALQPNFPVALNNLGNAQLGLKKMQEAIQSYDKAIKFRPDYAQAYNNRGNALRELKRMQEAVESYDKAIELNNNFSDAYLNRGNILQAMNKLEEAVNSYDKVISINPSDAEAFNNKGLAYLELNKLEYAMHSFNRAIEIIPRYSEALFNRGIVYQKLKMPFEAAESFQAAIEIEPKNYKYLLLGGLNYIEQKNIPAAEKLFYRCLEAANSNESDVKIRSVAYMRLGMWREAFDSCQEVLPSIKSELHDSFNDHAKAKHYIDGLPELNFTCPMGWAASRTVMFAADKIYIERYFSDALRSIEETNPSLNVHLHAMLISESEFFSIKSFVKKNVTLSYEIYNPMQKTGYTTRRFIRLYQLLDKLKGPIICLDIDSKAVGNLQPLFDQLILHDIGLYRRDGEIVINQLIAGGMFGANFTLGAYRFLEFLINYVNRLESTDRLTWFSDQMALLATDKWVNRSYEKVSVMKIPEYAMSWSSCNDQTIVYTLKGEKKDFA